MWKYFRLTISMENANMNKQKGATNRRLVLKTFNQKMIAGLSDVGDHFFMFRIISSRAIMINSNKINVNWSINNPLLSLGYPNKRSIPSRKGLTAYRYSSTILIISRYDDRRNAFMKASKNRPQV